jgi:hypothetical protein
LRLPFKVKPLGKGCFLETLQEQLKKELNVDYALSQKNLLSIALLTSAHLQKRYFSKIFGFSQRRDAFGTLGSGFGDLAVSVFAKNRAMFPAGIRSKRSQGREPD